MQRSIHTRIILSPLYPRFFFAKRYKLPLFIVPHGTSDPYVYTYNTLKKRLWLTLIGYSAIKYSQAIIFSSAAEKNKSVFPFALQKGLVCPFSIEIKNISRTESRKYLQQLLGIDDNQKILLYFSKLDTFKRPIETIKAFIKINPKNWKMVVIGYTDNLQIRDDVLKLAANSNILFHPPVYSDDKWKILAGADIFVLLSHRENFGFAVVEAASVGTPVVISTGVDISCYFSPATSQLCFDIEDSSDIEACLQKILNYSHEEIRVLGEFSKKIVQNNFSFSEFSDTLYRVLGQGKRI